MTTRWLAVMLLALPLCSPARAEHTNPVGQDRFVRAQASSESQGYDEYGGPLLDETHASGYGQFDSTAEASSSTHHAGGHATATQSSIIDHDTMTATAQVSSGVSVDAVLGIYAGASGLSQFKFGFGLAKPVQYHVEGTLSATGVGTSTLVIERYDVPFFERSAPTDGSLEVALDGTLEPGVYEIVVRALSAASSELYGESGAASFAVTIDLDRIVPVDHSSVGALKSRYGPQP